MVVLLNIKDISIPSYLMSEFDNVTYFRLNNAIAKYGQIRTILVREIASETEERKFELAEGRNVLRSLKENNFQFVEAKNLGFVSEAEAILAALALNNISFQSDFVEIAALVSRLLEDNSLGAVESCLPYDKREIEKLKHIFEFNWAEFQEKKYKLKELVGTLF